MKEDYNFIALIFGILFFYPVMIISGIYFGLASGFQVVEDLILQRKVSNNENIKRHINLFKGWGIAEDNPIFEYKWLKETR